MDACPSIRPKLIVFRGDDTNGWSKASQREAAVPWGVYGQIPGSTSIGSPTIVSRSANSSRSSTGLSALR